LGGIGSTQGNGAESESSRALLAGLCAFIPRFGGADLEENGDSSDIDGLSEIYIAAPVGLDPAEADTGITSLRCTIHLSSGWDRLGVTGPGSQVDLECSGKRVVRAESSENGGAVISELKRAHFQNGIQFDAGNLDTHTENLGYGEDAIGGAIELSIDSVRVRQRGAVLVTDCKKRVGGSWLSVSGQEFARATVDPIVPHALEICKEFNESRLLTEDMALLAKSAIEGMDMEIHEAWLQWVDRLGADIAVQTVSAEGDSRDPRAVFVRVPFKSPVTNFFQAKSALTMLGQSSWERQTLPVAG